MTTFNAVRMNNSGVTHLATEYGFPMCGGRYGNQPGIIVKGGEVSCRKCAPILADMTARAAERVAEVAASVVPQQRTDSGPEMLSERSTYTVRFTHGTHAITVSDVAAESPHDAIVKARAMLQAESVEQFTYWVVG